MSNELALKTQGIALLLGHQCARVTRHEDVKKCKSVTDLCNLWAANMKHNPNVGVVTWPHYNRNKEGARWMTESGRLTIEVFGSSVVIIVRTTFRWCEHNGYVQGDYVAKVSYHLQRNGHWTVSIDHVEESLLRGREDRIRYLVRIDETVFDGLLEAMCDKHWYEDASAAALHDAMEVERAERYAMLASFD